MRTLPFHQQPVSALPEVAAPDESSRFYRVPKMFMLLDIWLVYVYPGRCNFIGELRLPSVPALFECKRLIGFCICASNAGFAPGRAARALVVAAVHCFPVAVPCRAVLCRALN